MTWRGHWRLEALVRERSQARGAARHVLLEIAIHARSDTDETDVSTRQLAEWTGHDLHTVGASVKELVRIDELEVREGGRGNRNGYRVKVEILERSPARTVWPVGQIPSRSDVRIPSLPRGVTRDQTITGDGEFHQGDGQIPSPVMESSNTNRAPIESQRESENRESAPNGAHRAVALVDGNIDRPGTPEVREMARVALSRLANGNKLRPLLAELGWDEDQHGKVTDWLLLQNHDKLREVIAKAHDALTQTAREKRRAGGQ